MVIGQDWPCACPRSSINERKSGKMNTKGDGFRILRVPFNKSKAAALSRLCC
jgi:hypothetical protein